MRGAGTALVRGAGIALCVARGPRWW